MRKFTGDQISMSRITCVQNHYDIRRTAFSISHKRGGIIFARLVCAQNDLQFTSDAVLGVGLRRMNDRMREMEVACELLEGGSRRWA